jgi:hypothetical protein
VHGFVERERADRRESCAGKVGLTFSVDPGILVRIRHRLIELRFQACVAGQMSAQLYALLFDRQTPRTASQPGLVAPLQQLNEQHCQSADQFAPFASAHAFDFFRDVLDIGFGQPAGAQQCCLLVGPGVEVRVVEGRVFRRHGSEHRQRCHTRPILPHRHQPTDARVGPGHGVKSPDFRPERRVAITPAHRSLPERSAPWTSP